MSVALGAAALLAGGATSAHAQFALPDLIASESFDYPAGPLAGQNGGTGLLDPWTQANAGNLVSSAGLEYQSGTAALLSAGNKVEFSGQNNGNFRNLAYVLGEHPATVYVSFLAKVSSAGYAGLSFYYLSDEKYFMGRPTGRTDWGASRPDGTDAVLTGIPATSQAFVVYRYDFNPPNGTTVSVYINPPLDQEPAAPTAGPTPIGNFTADSIRIQSGTENASGTIDEIRIGTRWARIAPTRAATTLVERGYDWIITPYADVELNGQTIELVSHFPPKANDLWGEPPAPPANITFTTAWVDRHGNEIGSDSVHAVSQVTNRSEIIDNKFDTVVHRANPVTLGGVGQEKNVSLEIIWLSLKSKNVLPMAALPPGVPPGAYILHVGVRSNIVQAVGKIRLRSADASGTSGWINMGAVGDPVDTSNDFTQPDALGLPVKWTGVLVPFGLEPRWENVVGMLDDLSIFHNHWNEPPDDRTPRWAYTPESSELAIEVSARLQGNALSLTLSWRTGTGPFGIQSLADFNKPVWVDVTNTIFSSVTLLEPLGKGATFYRVVDRFVAGPGEAPVRQAMAEPRFTEGLTFEPFEIIPHGEDRNPEPALSVSTGPLRGNLQPAQAASELLADNLGAGLLRAAADPVVFAQTTGIGRVVNSPIQPPDMSGAAADQVAFLTGNTWAAFSTNRGVSFTALDPTTVFPSRPTADHGGLCCDQVVQYDAQYDLFVWLMQFNRAPTGENMLRIAVATPQEIISSGGRSWTFWDLRSRATFGFGSDWLDYPDLATGSNSLYISADLVGRGLVVMRVQLAQLANRGVINIDYTDPGLSVQAYGGHITQQSGDAVFWAGHNNNSQMRVWTLPEASNVYSWRDVNINSWPNGGARRSLTPTRIDWLSFTFPDMACIGAARDAAGVWFAWTARPGGGFPQPHIQMVRLHAASLALVEQAQIWNPNHGYAYPALVSNSSGALGVALGFGGGGILEAGAAVGIWGDFVVRTPGFSTSSIDRFGDYLGIRRFHSDGRLFAASIYNRLNLGAGEQFNPIYVLFGRRSVVP
jgi:hypothetical protein